MISWINSFTFDGDGNPSPLHEFSVNRFEDPGFRLFLGLFRAHGAARRPTETLNVINELADVGKIDQPLSQLIAIF